MFAGHVGVALALGRAERRLNVAVLVAAALGLDVLLWLFVLAGWESASLPADFATAHQPRFVFPYSHGLVAAAAWSALAAAAAAFATASWDSRQRRRAALLVALAVGSHWVLDALVHRPELPLAGPSSAAVGLAMWDHMAAALLLEAALVAIGLGLFLPGSGLPRVRAAALAVLSLLLMAFTAVGMTLAPPPPSVRAMAASSLMTLVLVCAAFAWLGRAARARPG